MAVFKELNTTIALKLIEGYTDELAPEAEELDRLYSSFKCHRGCGALQKEFDPTHAFSDPDTAVPRALLRCATCHYLIDPHTRIVLSTGNPTEVAGHSSNVPNNI